jgi:hypothetical protein
LHPLVEVAVELEVAVESSSEVEWNWQWSGRGLELAVEWTWTGRRLAAAVTKKPVTVLRHWKPLYLGKLERVLREARYLGVERFNLTQIVLVFFIVLILAANLPSLQPSGYKITFHIPHSTFKTILTHFQRAKSFYF